MAAKVLVPLDGSPLAERALPLAREIARAQGEPVVLLKVVEARARRAPEPAVAPLEAVAARLRAEGVAAIVRTAYTGAGGVGRAIAELARQEGAGLIVMATHARRGLTRWAHGSVADAVVRTAELPVIVVPPPGGTGLPEHDGPRIVVPLDGSTLAEAALAPIAELAGTLKAPLHLIEVVEPWGYTMATEPSVYVPVDPEEALAEARAYLDQTATWLRAMGLSVTTQAVVGSAVTEIARVAREIGATLIALGSHGRGGVARALLGSVATGILQRAEVPVMIVRQAAVPRGAAAATRNRAAIASQPAEPANESAITAEPAVPADELALGRADAPTATLAVTATELELVERGLELLLDRGSLAPDLAATARELLHDVRHVHFTARAEEPVGVAPTR